MWLWSQGDAYRVVDRSVALLEGDDQCGEAYRTVSNLLTCVDDMSICDGLANDSRDSNVENVSRNLWPVPGPSAIQLTLSLKSDVIPMSTSLWFLIC